jgi:hypothetical protein
MHLYHMTCHMRLSGSTYQPTNNFFQRKNGLVRVVLNPSQIVSRLTFLISSLTTRLIQSFVQNITFFVVYWFINKSSSRMT